MILATGYAELSQELTQPDFPRLSKPFSQAELAAALWQAKPASVVPSTS